MIYYILTLIGGIALGIFVEWILTRPEPEGTSKFDEEEWAKCMEDTCYCKKEKPKRIKNKNYTTNPNDPGPYSSNVIKKKIKKKKK